VSRSACGGLTQLSGDLKWPLKKPRLNFSEQLRIFLELFFYIRSFSFPLKKAHAILASNLKETGRIYEMSQV
jgi:hypothetical protein